MIIFDDGFRTRLLELFTWRRDVRRFRPDPLPPGTLERLIRIACLSPSVGLSQPWRFVIVDDPARRRAIAEVFQACNAEALSSYQRGPGDRYAKLKLAGISSSAQTSRALLGAASPHLGGSRARVRGRGRPGVLVNLPRQSRMLKSRTLPRAGDQRSHRANCDGMGGSASYGLGRRRTTAPGGLLSAESRSSPPGRGGSDNSGHEGTASRGS